MQTNIISGADHIFEWVNLITPFANEHSILVALIEGLFISSILLFILYAFPKIIGLYYALFCTMALVALCFFCSYIQLARTI